MNGVCESSSPVRVLVQQLCHCQSDRLDALYVKLSCIFIEGLICNMIITVDNKSALVQLELLKKQILYMCRQFSRDYVSFCACIWIILPAFSRPPLALKIIYKLSRRTPFIKPACVCQERISVFYLSLCNNTYQLDTEGT